MKTVKEFLETYICKAGESIQQISESEWEIQKWTVRTYKVLGNVLAAGEYDVHPPGDILKLQLKPNSKKTSLAISSKLIQEALRKGWLIQEIRFKSDGRTPDSTVFRMGPGLEEYERVKKLEAMEADDLLRQTLLQEIEKSNIQFPLLFIRHIKDFVVDTKDEESWGKEKVRKFTEFLLAYLQLRNQQSQMEFKEIGATYFRRIGGSKVFDSYRDDFIRRIEKWIDAPISEIGIVSTGSIVPIFFTGNLTGQLSHYSAGTVHATTEIAVMDESYVTDAEILWLVENRAVLTRMAKELDFLADTSSLIIGVDGQLRGAHRKLIQQLCCNSSIQQIVIWVDYDAAGRVIARDLAELTKGISVRFIGNERNVFMSYPEYLEWSETVPEAEQEMTLGGPAEWRKWISK
ncbi:MULTISPECIES: DUF2399 domain-containing protein [unclassified Sporosarcina]|uniref:DUF2399 domain-containing protein n=1 Tax=unclassified Sporosarcina TaxID=2647733 RepID=UPI00203ACF32|nr:MULTISPECIES: DUF2399 domain-containing protein [unclassified Sporosarcina]GKV64963.1 hypothetical protein NCCP2331_11160 [Sporosarcina sp. NCCP-2331]GLB56598.1 hypothetical protein NCCP2378_23850 [Sporosarcina sp. NCCP-2378]